MDTKIEKLDMSATIELYNGLIAKQTKEKVSPEDMQVLKELTDIIATLSNNAISLGFQ